MQSLRLLTAADLVFPAKSLYALSMTTINDDKMAYIIGVTMGDGCIYDSGDRAYIKFVMEDRDIMEHVATFHTTLTGHHCNVRPIKKKPHLSALNLTNTRLARDFCELTQRKTILPTLTSVSAKMNFIAGLMDTDGHISQNTTTNGQSAKRWTRFSLGFVNSGLWLGDFLKLLQEFAVTVGKPVLKRKYRSCDEKDCWQVAINLKSFSAAGLFFRCQRKQNVLLAYCDHMRKG